MTWISELEAQRRELQDLVRIATVDDSPAVRASVYSLKARLLDLNEQLSEADEYRRLNRLDYDGL